MTVKIVIGFEKSEKLSETTIPHNNHLINFPITISDDDFEDFSKANNELKKFLNDTELFKIVIWNYEEYYKVLENFLNAYKIKNQEYIKKYPLYLNINRMALNYLSSVRTYLDHTETFLNHRFGSESNIFRNFIKHCNKAYDSNFSYRFLYKLRNYTQHCGFPIGIIQIIVKPDEIEKDKPSFSLNVSANRDSLLSEFDWNKLKSEIINQPEAININEHMDKLMECLFDINLNVTKDLFSTLFEAASFIKNLISKVPKEDGIPGIYKIDILEDENGKPLEFRKIENFPINWDLVESVLNKNLDNILGKIEIEHY